MNIQNLLTLLHEKMTDSEIGEAIGASQPTVTRLRNGVHKKTFHDRHEAIKKLAIKYGIDAA